MQNKYENVIIEIQQSPREIKSNDVGGIEPDTN
jgi:hypothetical protein